MSLLELFQAFLQENQQFCQWFGWSTRSEIKPAGQLLRYCHGLIGRLLASRVYQVRRIGQKFIILILMAQISFFRAISRE